MTEQKKSYFAIIPANVRYDESLSANAKLLYGEITALCNNEGYCWASNKYFADLYGVSNRSIKQWIKLLSDKGYIKTNVLYKKGTKEIENRFITIVSYPGEEKFTTWGRNIPYPGEEKFTTPGEENFPDNNTVINNTDEYIKKEIDKEKSGKPTPSRKKYGMYSNVLLTDEDYSKLQTEFPADYEERIERLSEYKASSGKRYKNDLATIRAWARKDKGKQQNKQKTAKTSPYGEMKKGLNL